MHDTQDLRVTWSVNAGIDFPDSIVTHCTVHKETMLF